MFGSNVTLAVAGRPVAPALRDLAYQFNMPIHIGSHVWIGAGSVVTCGTPANSIAAGNPCRAMREISERDYECYCHDRKIEAEELKILMCNQEGLFKNENGKCSA